MRPTAIYRAFHDDDVSSLDVTPTTTWTTDFSSVWDAVNQLVADGHQAIGYESRFVRCVGKELKQPARGIR